MEGSRETVMWGARQILNAYEELARLIHGEPVTLVEGSDDEDDVPEDEEAEEVESVDEDEVETEVRAASASDNNAVHLRPEVIVPTIISAGQKTGQNHRFQILPGRLEGAVVH